MAKNRTGSIARTVGVVTFMAVAGASPVLAQAPDEVRDEAQASPQAPSQAQAGRTATFDIPAQPLSQALTTFGRQSGMQIAVDSAAVAGKTSGAMPAKVCVWASSQISSSAPLSVSMARSRSVGCAGSSGR